MFVHYIIPTYHSGISGVLKIDFYKCILAILKNVWPSNT